MQKRGKGLWVVILVLLTISGCAKTIVNHKQYGETTLISVINRKSEKTVLKGGMPYVINFVSDCPGKGSVTADFDRDGKKETLNYTTIVTLPGDRGSFISECRINIGNLKFSQQSEEGISCLGVVDIDQRDRYVEFYLSNGELRGGMPEIYRYDGKKIVKVVTLDGGIQAVSGDGKVYYWGGNLYEPEGRAFDPHLVLSYYDLAKKNYVQTNQIAGRTITADREVLVYKDIQDVPEGPPVEVDVEALQRDGKLVKILQKGDRFKVLSLQAGTRVKLPDGQEGWIGGFHMVWD